MKMKYALSLALLTAFAGGCATTPSMPPGPPPPAPPMVSIFAVAHQDDWQLFMNPDAYRSMDEPQEKAVFIHVTAGDAGAGAGGDGPAPYYLAREEGALRAVRFMANAADPTIGKGVKMESAMVDRGGHGVQRYAYANAVVYFLRLPDGNIVNGTVYTPHPESLTRLRSGEASTSGTVEQSARYEGWQDLVGTLNAIVESERVSHSGLKLHIAELDEELNPLDHPDHRAVAFAMEDVAKRHPCAPVHRHLEYHTKTKPVNVTGTDYMIDVGTWAATASGLGDNYAKATWEPEHNAWIGRNYFRVTPPAGPCPSP
ncbi:MAG: hypothetical protein EOP61_19965 [Sphingomonadales bacterium]|nr:MAG: hypothetical protein EOP61_19965 [Sphingomonadales bacterium]